MPISILKKLHDGAMNCRNAELRSVLQDHRNNIVACVRKLEFSFKDEHLRELNGLWALAYVMLDKAKAPVDDPGGQSGAGEVLQLEKLAA